MESFKSLLVKFLPHLLLTAFLVKSHFLPSGQDSAIIAGLCLLSGYRMYLNSVFDVKIQDQIKSLKEVTGNKMDLERELTLKHIEDIYTDMRGKDDEVKSSVELLRKDIDIALANVTAATNEELVRIKGDLGQMDLTKGITNGKGKQIFF